MAVTFGEDLSTLSAKKNHISHGLGSLLPISV